MNTENEFSTQSPHAKAPTRRCIKWFQIALWLTFFAILYRVANWFYPLDFYLYRHRYEAVVAAVKSSNIPKNRYLDWDVKWGILGPELIPWTSYPSWHARADTVRAVRDSTGYTISIVTVDQGHFGFGGYIFADSESSAALPLSDSWGDSPFERIHSKIVHGWWWAEGSG